MYIYLWNHKILEGLIHPKYGDKPHWEQRDALVMNVCICWFSYSVHWCATHGKPSTCEKGQTQGCAKAFGDIDTPAPNALRANSPLLIHSNASLHEYWPYSSLTCRYCQMLQFCWKSIKEYLETIIWFKIQSKVYMYC